MRGGRAELEREGGEEDETHTVPVPSSIHAMQAWIHMIIMLKNKEAYMVS